MVTGSFASSVHGEPRATQDLDLVIDPTPSSLNRFLDQLADDRFYFSHEAASDAMKQRGMFNIIEFGTGWKIDLIIRKNRPFSIEEFARRRMSLIDSQTLSMASPEDVVLAKLEWAKSGGSTRQLDDVKSILRTLGHDLDRAYIERWADELGGAELWRQIDHE